MTTLTYWGQQLEVFRHLYNCTWLNERGAELAVWQHWRRNVPTLEVGNVLNHYDPFPHHVVDRYEVADGVENIDVFDVAGQWEQIVTISTLEHVRWDEEPRVDGQSIAAVQHLSSQVGPAGRMLVTIPTGHNPPLDEWLGAGETGATRACTLVRDMDTWRQTDEVEIRPYGLTQPWAEAVWIGEFG